MEVSLGPGGSNLSIWSVHLDWRSYGAYAACNRLVTEASQVSHTPFALLSMVALAIR